MKMNGESGRSLEKRAGQKIEITKRRKKEAKAKSKQSEVLQDQESENLGVVLGSVQRVNRESVRNQDHVLVKGGVVLEVEEEQDADIALVQDPPAGDAVHLEEGVPTAPDLDTEDVLDPDPCEDRLRTAEDIVVIQEVTQGDAVLIALTEEEVVADIEPIVKIPQHLNAWECLVFLKAQEKKSCVPISKNLEPSIKSHSL